LFEKSKILSIKKKIGKNHRNTDFPSKIRRLNCDNVLQNDSPLLDYDLICGSAFPLNIIISVSINIGGKTLIYEGDQTNLSIFQTLNLKEIFFLINYVIRHIFPVFFVFFFE